MCVMDCGLIPEGIPSLIITDRLQYEESTMRDHTWPFPTMKALGKLEKEENCEEQIVPLQQSSLMSQPFKTSEVTRTSTTFLGKLSHSLPQEQYLKAKQNKKKNTRRLSAETCTLMKN